MVEALFRGQFQPRLTSTAVETPSSAVMGFDLAAYFDRIGLAASASADLDTLRNIVAAHGRSIPFENLDPLLGSWYASTHPGRVFVVGLSAALVTDDARMNLRGRNLAIHSAGETERIRFDTAAQVLDALTGRADAEVPHFA